METWRSRPPILLVFFSVFCVILGILFLANSLTDDPGFAVDNFNPGKWVVVIPGFERVVWDRV